LLLFLFFTHTHTHNPVLEHKQKKRNNMTTRKEYKRIIRIIDTNIVFNDRE
jgi:hypothetical protein